MNNSNNKLITRKEVEDILNYFQNIGDNGQRLFINDLDHYQHAFVNESYYQAVQYHFSKNDANEKTCFNYVPKESSERLEYLGDHILKAIIGRYLFERFENEREGFLTKLKIKIERCSMLHKIAVELGFKKFLLLSLQVENQTILDLDRGRNTFSFLEDAFEAFIGSILVDFGESGYLYADRFVRSVIENVIDFAELISKNDNFKDSIQRFFQMKGKQQSDLSKERNEKSNCIWKTPIYQLINENGPLYRKVFTKLVYITNEQFDTLDDLQRENIRKYTSRIMDEYRVQNPDVFSTLIEKYQRGDFILGIGFGRKVTNAEQECAKQCLLNLNLDLNY